MDPCTGKQSQPCSVCHEAVCLPTETTCKACTTTPAECPDNSIVLPLSCLATQSDSTVQIQGTVEAVPANMLVDTGSCVTLLSTSFAKSLSHRNVHLSISPVNTVLKAVNNSSVPVLGEAVVLLATGKLAVRHRVIVADIMPDVLIGIDFLQSHGCTIDFGRNMLDAGGVDVPLEPTHNANPVVCRVHLANSVTVPAYTQVIVQAQLRTDDNHLPSSAGFVSPSEKFISKFSTAMSRVVATPDSAGRVWIRLQNFLPHSTTVPKNYQIAEFDSDIYIDDDLNDSPTHAASVDEHSCSAVQEESCSPSEPDDLFDLRHLDPQAQSAIATVLNDNADIISQGQFDLGKTDVVTHNIQTTSDQPKRQPPRRIPLSQRAEVKQHVDQLLDHEIISPSRSPWAAPIVVVRKPDSSIRLCIDYRQLNSITEKDAFPLPRVDDAIDAMAGARYFSTLDLAAGYWQVEIDEAAKAKSAFVTPFGLFEWNRMPFGLCNAPATFQRLMNRVLGDLVPNICLVYLDDIIVFSSTIEEHMSRLQTIFSRLRQAGLKIKPKKCSLLQSSVTYLGFLFSEQGVAPDASKFTAVQDWSSPTSLKEVRSFVGFASYYRRFVPHFSEIVEPLNRLSQKNATFNWTHECEQAFAELKSRLVKSPVLTYPDPAKRFILDTDASDLAMGAVLSQVNSHGEEVVIAYASKALTRSQRNMGSTRKELLAVVTFTAHFRHYLLGNQFTLRTDHKALIWLHSFREVDGLLARWIERLAVFDYVVTHRPGKQHVNADALSRLRYHSPATATSPTPTPEQRVGEQNIVVNHLSSASPDSNPVTVNAEVSPPNWCESFTVEELRRAQLEDADVSTMIGWQEALLDRPLRSDSAMHGASIALIRLWSQWKRLRLIDGVLYRVYHPENSDTPYLQFVVPQSLQSRMLQSVHADVSGSHLGIERTQDKLRKRCYWPFMSSAVSDFCQACDICESRKAPLPKAKAPLVQDRPSFPLEKVAIDIMGPLPTTPSGNKYLVVICDYFTKWPEAFPVPNITAETIAHVLVDGFFCRYGIPYQLHSDRGAQFESRLFQQICQLLDIRKSRTTAYRPQSDGLVERMNRTLEQMLAAHVDDHHTNWDRHLQRCLLAYRSSVHSSTKETPAMLMLGHEIHLPVDVMFQSPDSERSHVNTYVINLRRNLQRAFTHARDAGATAQRRQKAHYDKHAKQPKLNVGDMVRLHSPAVKPGTTSKFHRPWKGPYTVLERVDDVVLRIADKSGTTQTVHVDRLKAWTGSDLPASANELVPNSPPTSIADYMPDVEYNMQPVPIPAPVQAPPAPVIAAAPVPPPAAALNHAPVPVVHHYDLRNRANIQPPARFAQ